MSVYKRLKQIRIDHNLSQVEYAIILRVLPKDMSRMESGKVKEIPNSVLQILYEKFQINMNWFFTGFGEINRGEIIKHRYLEDRVQELEEKIKLIMSKYVNNNDILNIRSENSNESGTKRTMDSKDFKQLTNNIEAKFFDPDKAQTKDHSSIGNTAPNSEQSAGAGT